MPGKYMISPSGNDENYVVFKLLVIITTRKLLDFYLQEAINARKHSGNDECQETT
jgi:hypothetical protein